MRTPVGSADPEGGSGGIKCAVSRQGGFTLGKLQLPPFAHRVIFPLPPPPQPTSIRPTCGDRRKRDSHLHPPFYKEEKVSFKS